MDVLKENITLTIAVSKFNYIYFGDIKFFSYLIGKLGIFTINESKVNLVLDSLTETKYSPRKISKNALTCSNKIVANAPENNTKTTTKNDLGTNVCPLQNIDNDKLMLSTLHCKIGQLNKFNINADKWELLHVKNFNQISK